MPTECTLNNQNVLTNSETVMDGRNVAKTLVQLSCIQTLNQFSTVKFSTRVNSRSFAVTTVKPTDKAWAAINNHDDQ
jgi:hypothetical protein